MNTTCHKGTVVFEHVSKSYRLGALKTLRGTLAERIKRPGNADDHILWALRDVSFRLEPGQTLGLIGPNGAGKTTTLKLLSNITKPTSGAIQVHGRRSSLIELGAGFHPELTGRENVYLNAAILGLKRREIQRKFDDIVAFAELERFIDTPVKRYSSGMYVRLGFAVAAHIEPDVLLVDEVLAVGDNSFRQKCMDRMDALRRSGTTIIFVSHNMAQVEQLCEQAMLLINGRATFLGDVKGALAAYQRHLHTERGMEARLHAELATDALVIRAIEVHDEEGQNLTEISYQEPIHIKIHYDAVEPVIAPLLRIWLLRQNGTICAMSLSGEIEGKPWELIGEGVISVRIAPLQLVSGQYRVEVMIVDRADSIALAGGYSDSFYVHGPWSVHHMDAGVYVPLAEWRHYPHAVTTTVNKAPSDDSLP